MDEKSNEISDMNSTIETSHISEEKSEKDTALKTMEGVGASSTIETSHDEKKDKPAANRSTLAVSVPGEEILGARFDLPGDQNSHKGHDFRGAHVTVNNYYGEVKSNNSAGEVAIESSGKQLFAYLCGILKSFPRDKVELLAKELQDDFEIYVPDDLLHVHLEDLKKDIKTVKKIQKKKLVLHVEEIQKKGYIENHQPRMKKIDDGIFADLSKSLRQYIKAFKGERRLPGEVDPEDLTVMLLDITGSTHEDKLPRKFKEAINNMLKLHHNNVEKFVQCGNLISNAATKTLYIATSLYHQKTLADIDIRALQYLQRIAILVQVCNAVKYIHSKEVSHRNLRPSNMLISLDGRRVVISEIGLNKSSSDANRGLGWTAPEMRFRGKTNETDFFKVDIFNLGLFGHYLFCNKLHAFCHNKFPEDEITLQSNIFGKSGPNFKALKETEEGHIAANLFGKMLNCDPAKRCDIQQVLQHCIFWDTDKKVQFIIDMHEGYFDKETGLNLEENGTEEQKLAFDDITPAKVQNTNNGILESRDAPSSPTSPHSDFSGSDQDGESLDSAGDHESLSSDSESSSGGFFISPSERDKEQKRKEIRKVCSERWMDLIMGTTNRLDAGKTTTDKESYKNTLAELDRYIRNYHVHRTRDTKATWKFFVQKFPELLPYLIRIMESTLSDQHQLKYKFHCAPAYEVDLSDLLS